MSHHKGSLVDVTSLVSRERHLADEAAIPGGSDDDTGNHTQR